VAGGHGGKTGSHGGNGQPGLGGPGGAKTAGCTADRPGQNGRKAPSCEFDVRISSNGEEGKSWVYEFDGFAELN
jgi:hypothetical protein